MKRAFLLEDNRANAEVMIGYLEMVGFDYVEWVQTLREAIPRVPDVPDYDLVLLDIMLEDGESIDMAKDLKHHYKVKYLCAYTARTTVGDVAYLQSVGFDHVFKKPLRFSVFRQELAQIMPHLFDPATAKA